MIGILLMTHGMLGESLLHCASHILGSRPRQLAQIGVTPQDDPQLILPLAIRLARSVDSGQGLIVMTDIFGGTPSNVATHLLVPGRVEVVVESTGSSSLATKNTTVPTTTTARPDMIQAVRFMRASYPPLCFLKRVTSAPEAAMSRPSRWIGSPTTVDGLPTILLTNIPPRPWSA